MSAFCLSALFCLESVQSTETTWLDLHDPVCTCRRRFACSPVLLPSGADNRHSFDKWQRFSSWPKRDSASRTCGSDLFQALLHYGANQLLLPGFSFQMPYRPPFILNKAMRERGGWINRPFTTVVRRPQQPISRPDLDLSIPACYTSVASHLSNSAAPSTQDPRVAVLSVAGQQSTLPRSTEISFSRRRHGAIGL